MEINSKMPKAYVHSEHETGVYQQWLESGAFEPHTDTSKPAFSLIMPPPNANGNLHMGHALEVAIMDILTRSARMRGERALWLPGSDHAGIETQVVFEKKLEKEGRSRFQMTREQFYQEIMEFTLSQKHNMETQLQMLGASPAWQTEKFTLDPEIIKRVYRTFRQLYADGLIYRGERIVNYSVKYQTAYSDLEVVWEERQDPLYYIKYGPLTLATVRPETKFGDTAVAVNPNDPRYQQYIGTTIEAKMVTGEIRKLPVIADDFVKMDFGTGVVKVTPGHDPNDFEMGKRHNLPIINIIDKRGRLTEVAGEFAGMKAAEARPKIVEKMQAMGMIEKIDTTYRHAVALCYKSMQPIEPLVMPQWYVKVGPLRDKAVEAIKNGETKFLPVGYKKIMLDWLENLRDWNISRQIWWGIPIKGVLDDAAIGDGRNAKEIFSAEDLAILQDDQDTFDTWFSSGQWPYLTLEANSTPERDYLKEFYPTTVMQSGPDLIFLWITRMLLMGLYTQNAVPFQQVYFHGLILDPLGKKMSKSKGNVVSPVELCKEYGADAVRFGLIIGSSAGSNNALPVEKIIGGRNFANKLWNLGRFLEMQVSDLGTGPELLTAAKPVTPEDEAILSELQKLKNSTAGHIKAFRFAQALQELQEFSREQFADVYVEQAKARLQAGTEATALAGVLLTVYFSLLRLIHPFMPFVTEAIWGQLASLRGDQALLISQVEDLQTK